MTTKALEPHQTATLISALCIAKSHGAEGITADTIRQVADDVLTEWMARIQGDFDEKILLLQEQVNTLAAERNKLIDSCWYRTKARKIHWIQGRYFGTSIADYTETAAYIEAINAIRHNAGLKPVEELD